MKSRRLNRYFKSAKNRFSTKDLIFFFGASFLVVLFFYQYVASGNKILGGDFDYYASQYEAFRITVLKYHQLPFWNPWLSGGIPLFANPQFGLISIQSILVLIFGAVYGLKIAFVVYALIGYWGMYALGRRVLDATRTRSALIAYIWVFCGFFAGHGVTHLTFTSFYLLPWLMYFVAQRRQKYSWLGLGVVYSALMLSSLHYAFLMLTLVLVLYSLLSISRVSINRKSLDFNLSLTRLDIQFGLKAALTIIILAGYQLYQTYAFESNNQRITGTYTEPPNSVGLVAKSLFLPIGTLIKHYPKTTWGWGEYSMYVGLGTGLALLVCVSTLAYGIINRKRWKYVSSRGFVIAMMIIGLLGALIGLGARKHLSLFNLLHSLPGFTQTRVPSRWVIITVFSLLILLLAWQRNKRLINILLAFSVLELFLSYGPPRINGNNMITIPQGKFSPTFSQYSNGLKHIGVAGSKDPITSYVYTTSLNEGQIYADDSLINTMSGFTPLPTSRCAVNIDKKCKFVVSNNAKVVYWSPNKIEVKRTAKGPIELNMNVERGWRINNSYPFAGIKNLAPINHFVLSGEASNYSLEYAPKLSPSWISWRAQRL